MPGKARGKGEWTGPFLIALAETGVIERAAKAAGIVAGTVTDRRKRYASFEEEFQGALAAHRDAAGDAAPLWPPHQSGLEPELPAWCAPFLAALAENSSVAKSAAQVKVLPSNAYRMRRENAAFAAGWRAALLEGYEHLEMEVLGYLRDQKPKRKMDVTAALRLLAAHREMAARERALREEDDEQAVRDSIDRFLDDMRERHAANTAILIEAHPGAAQPEHDDDTA